MFKITNTVYKTMPDSFIFLVVTFCLLSFRVLAQTPVADDDPGLEYNQKVLDACLTNSSVTATIDRTIGQLRDECRLKVEGGLIDYRETLEKQVGTNPFALLPHRQNYILPLSYSNPKNDIYTTQLDGRSLDWVETEIQISIKYVIAEDILNENFDLEFGFTTTSWWQTYNGNISAPFRETNYEPELILSYEKTWSVLGLPIRRSFLSLNHQSNGQAGTLSRSWNRIIGGLTFQHRDLVWSAELWWRFPEHAKQSAIDPDGDDNPHIERYVGQGQIGLLWKTSRNHNLGLQFRNNLRSDNRGSIKLGWSFPFSDRLRGYLQIFNGYGESLISYDRSSSRIGIGILLSDLL